MTDRKKPSVAFWATVSMVVLLVGYALSLGSLCWIERRVHIPEPLDLGLHYVYRPIIWARIKSHRIDMLFERHVYLWVDYSKPPDWD